MPARREFNVAGRDPVRATVYVSNMAKPSPVPVLILLLLAGVGFVLLSGRSLPPLVASHFSAGGIADGFMPRPVYLSFMAALVVGLPLVLVIANSSVRWIDPKYFNLPNRDYWLAPERIAATFAFLQRQAIQLALALAAFLCFVHWLVVKANAVQPPHLPETPFIAGSAIFLVAVLAWIWRYFRHFRRRP